MDVLTWAVIFAFFVIAEIASVQLVSIWFAVGALFAMLSSFFFDASFIAQFAVFTVTSGVFLALTFPFLRKWRARKAPVSTNAELDVGESAVVIEDINESIGTGRVTLKGVDWSAVPEDKDTIIPKNSIVTVKKVQGAKLIVIPKSN